MTPLATFEQDLRTALDDTGERIRSILDRHLPDLAAAETDPLAQAVATLTPQARTILADFVTAWVSAGALATQPAAPETDPAAPADPAQADAPAEVPQDGPAGPVVGGTAS